MKSILYLGCPSVERADTDKAHGVTCARIVAPDRDTTFRTTRDFLSLAAVRWRVDQFNVAMKERHSIALDHRVERERGSGFALAPAAMTAVDEHRARRHPIAHVAAGAAAVELRAVEVGLWQNRRRRYDQMVGLLCRNGWLDLDAIIPYVAELYETGEMIASGWLAASKLGRGTPGASQATRCS